jgi:autotransporter-associated beta strand protein
LVQERIFFIHISKKPKFSFLQTLKMTNAMKKIISLWAAAMLLAAVQVQAARHAITATGGLGAAINTLVSGSDFASNDTITLTRGATYTLGATVNTIHAKGVAIMADPDATGDLPVIDCANSDAFSLNGAADLPNAYFRLENLKFIGTGRSDGKYFITTTSASGTTIITITYGGIEVKGCVFELKSRAFLRGRVQLAMSSILFEDCIFQNSEDGSTGGVYGIIHPEYTGTNTIASIKLKNTTIYNTTNVVVNCARSLVTKLEVENCSFLYTGKTGLVNLTSLQSGSSVVFKNNIIKGYHTTAASAPAQAINITYNSDVSVLFQYNYVTGVTLTNLTAAQHTVQELSKSSDAIDVSFDALTSSPISYVISGADASYLRTAGFGGACVGDPRSYPGYTPPEPGKLTWIGADDALWNVATNWSPNELPSEAGTATIGSGVAQSSGGKMNSTIILQSGGTLKLSAAPDTITKLELDGGTLEGASALQGEVNLTSKSTVRVANSGETLTLPVSITGSDTLVKTGAGTLYLTAASNAFAGTWSVEAGALKVDEAGTALGTEVKVDLRGGTLELSGEVVSLPGLFFANGVALAVGTYTAASHPDLASGAGSLRITDSRVFRYVSQTRVSWDSKFNWSPVRALVDGDTAVVEGSYPVGDGTYKAYDVELSPATFPAGAKLILRDGARARLSLSAAATATRNAFAADVEVAKGVLYTSTTSKNLFGLDGELAILDTAYFQPDARVETDTVASGLLENKISPISIGATLRGSKPIVLSVAQNPANHGGTYGVQLVKENNLAFTGDWLVQKANLVGTAAACFGRSNTIYLESGVSLYLNVADATDKTQAVSAAQGAKIYLNGDTRLTTLTLGGTAYAEGEYTAATHPDYISGTGAIKLGVVPVASITISAPDDVEAVVTGTPLQLSAVAYPLNADDREVTWSVTSGDATINAATGLLTAGATPGSITVQAQTLNGVSATKTITALAAQQLITSISVAGPANMEMGESVVYTASYEPANATNVTLVWEITAGEADTVRLSNSRLQVVSTTTNPLTLKVSALAAPDVSATKQTSIIRATSYTWVANDAQTAGSDGAWEHASYWTPQALPQAGDTAYVYENATENKFALGTGGQDQEHAKFPAKLFLLPGAKLRVAVTNDNTAGLDPFTSAWDTVTSAYRAEASFYLLGGTIGVYSNSAKTWGVDGEINVLEPSYLYIAGPSPQAALYVFAEVKGSSTLILTGRETVMSNDPNETGAGLTYSESTIILRRANPDFTGTWSLDLVNLYTKEAQGFGKGNIVVGTGRKLIVDHEKAVDSTATITIASGGKISTRQSSSITIEVENLVLGGVTQEAGYYSKNTPAAASYFDNDRIIIKVGTVVQVPVESISISGPSQMAVGSDVQLTPLVLPSSAVQLVEWRVEPAELATISASGVLTSGSAAGCVTVTATATDESGASGTKQIAIGSATCGATAVAAEGYGTLTVSPNPVRAELRIADENLISEIRIYTLTATLLKTVPVNAKEATVDLSGYPDGAYLVVASYAGSDKKAAKVIVKN